MLSVLRNAGTDLATSSTDPGPDTRITASADRPGGVAAAQMISLLSTRGNIGRRGEGDNPFFSSGVGFGERSNPTYN